MKTFCLDCKTEKKSKKGSYCKPCGYKHRKRPSGLKYNIKKENRGWFKFKGGYLDEKGYLRSTLKGKLTRLHRIIMMKHLGRELESWEVVHHIDGNKQNNSISNLLVMSKEEHDNLRRI